MPSWLPPSRSSGRALPVPRAARLHLPARAAPGPTRLLSKHLLPALPCPPVSPPPLPVEGDRSSSDREDDVCLAVTCCPGIVTENASFPLTRVPVRRVSCKTHATLSTSCNPAFREVHLGVFACGYQGHLCMWLWAPLFFLHKALAPWCSQRWACTAGTAGHPRAGVAAREGWQARLGAGVGGESRLSSTGDNASQM